MEACKEEAAALRHREGRGCWCHAPERRVPEERLPQGVLHGLQVGGGDEDVVGLEAGVHQLPHLRHAVGLHHADLPGALDCTDLEAPEAV